MAKQEVLQKNILEETDGLSHASSQDFFWLVAGVEWVFLVIGNEHHALGKRWSGASLGEFGGCRTQST